MTTYTVHVTREGSAWLADVDGLEGAHTYARSLAALDRYVREVIVLADDLPDDAMESLQISYRYDVDDAVINDGALLAQRRRNLAAAHDRLTDETRDSVQHLRDAGYSVRDIAMLVGLTPGRVSQLAQHPRQRARQGRTRTAA